MFTQRITTPASRFLITMTSRFSSSLLESTFKTYKSSSPTPNVLHLQLNRPEKRNAMNEDFWNETTQIFKLVKHDKTTRVVVLSALGPTFSAGLDMSIFGKLFNLKKSGDPAKDAFNLRPNIEYLQDAFRAMRECSKPIISAVQGACVGGGVDLITSADIRLCSSDAWFQIKEIQMGLAADLGILQLFPRLLGSDSLARELIFTGRRFDSAEAKNCGFVSNVYGTHEELIDNALKLASTIAVHSPVALQTTKYCLEYSRDHSVEDGLRQITDLNQLMLQSPDMQTAATAAMSKQIPKFDDA